MYYYLQKEVLAGPQGLCNRQQFLFDTYGLFFLRKKENGNFIILQSFPFVDDNIIFIHGHYPATQKLVNENASCFTGKTIIINSCKPMQIAYSLKCTKSKIFYSIVDTHGYAQLRDGLHFGFNFKILDSELNAYNHRHLPLTQQLEKSYERLK